MLTHIGIQKTSRNTNIDSCFYLISGKNPNLDASIFNKIVSVKRDDKLYIKKGQDAFITVNGLKKPIITKKGFTFTSRTTESINHNAGISDWIAASENDYLEKAIRFLKDIGCKLLILTNAAGSLIQNMPAGSLMTISDHINWSGYNPLIGKNQDEYGPRFHDMSDGYHKFYRNQLIVTAKKTNQEIYEGIYCMYSGPNFETPAEIRAFRKLGADAVGMSTVPECLAAVHCGLRVMAIAVVTNLAAGMQRDLSHVETMTVGSAVTPKLSALLGGVMKRLALDY